MSSSFFLLQNFSYTYVDSCPMGPGVSTVAEASPRAPDSPGKSPVSPLQLPHSPHALCKASSGLCKLKSSKTQELEAPLGDCSSLLNQKQGTRLREGK